MDSTQENRPNQDNELVQPIKEYIDNGQPFDPEVIIALGKNRFASSILQLAMEQDSGTDPIEGPIWTREEKTRIREERCKKLFRFVYRKTIRIEAAGNIESSCGVPLYKPEGISKSKIGQAIAWRQYEGY